MQLVRAPARSATTMGNARVGLQQRDEQLAVVGIGRRGKYVQGKSVAVAQDVVLRTGFASIDRARTGKLAPLFARTATASTQQRVQSSTSASRSSIKMAWCSRSQTPASCHSRNRRHAVCPDPQPNFRGRSRQQQPVLSTNTIPSSAARSSIRGLPPGPFGGGRSGISGSTSSQSRSSIRLSCRLVTTYPTIPAQSRSVRIDTPSVLRPCLRKAQLLVTRRSSAVITLLARSVQRTEDFRYFRGIQGCGSALALRRGALQKS